MPAMTRRPPGRTGATTIEWIMLAGAMMIVPMIAVFVPCQRWFVRGIQLGAVKG